MSTSDRVLVEIVVNAPIETVWKAMRDPEALRRWFGWEYPGLAQEIDWILSTKSTPTGTYVQQISGMPDRYALEALDETHTVVRVIRAAPVGDASWTGIYDDLIDGWLMFLQQLRFMLERHAEADRRTIFLNGRAASADTRLPLDALGLSRLAIAPVGQAYAETTIATGDKIAGTVWFRSAHMIGITIDGFGDGLLIVTTRPITEKSTFGGGSLVLTTYGLSDESYHELVQRWSEWWRGYCDVIEIQPAS